MNADMIDSILRSIGLESLRDKVQETKALENSPVELNKSELKEV